MTKNPPFVNCPTCNKLIPWSEDNPYRPFCSERCKLIDLGEWASNSYAIKSESTGQPFEKKEEQNDE